MQAYVEEHGLIDELYIFDHGYTDTHQQQFGDVPITPEMFEQIAPFLSDDAVIVLGGCTVGADPDYGNAVADATGATVIASDANVVYDDDPWLFDWWEYDFYSEGEWEVFIGSDGEPTDPPSPGDLHLRTLPPLPGDMQKDRTPKHILKIHGILARAR